MSRVEFESEFIVRNGRLPNKKELAIGVLYGKF